MCDQLVDQRVFPGNRLKKPRANKGITVLGPGLHRDPDNADCVLVTRAGVLRHRSPNIYWLDGYYGRYVPRRGDLVVGVVFKKTGDILRVDIGASEPASLSLYSFEGATKKIKPNVQVGDAVYARVMNAHREMEPELVCVDSYYKAGTLGPLDVGDRAKPAFVVDMGPHFCARLLRTENVVLQALAKLMPFEVAIGLNGKIWMRARNAANVLRLLKAFDHITPMGTIE